MNKEEKDKLEELYYFYLNNDLIQRMKDISMHRGSNCYIHSFLVAKEAIHKALKKKKELDYEAILVGAILHDYYLYDWRSDKSLLKHHGKRHPFIAKDNAIKDFNINEKVANIILSHMWPINFKYFPKTKEARIVNNADTYIAFCEAITSNKYKAKRINKRIEKIGMLFE